MDHKKEIAIVDKTYLENKIYIIRGQKVMLDSDLAFIYGYTTSQFNRQVQRNVEKFCEDFMFRLTQKETELFLRCHFGILNKNNNKQGMHYKYRPYAFTESGIYMLMTVLKGSLATKQSIALIRLFRSMKDYIYENKDLLPYQELSNIDKRTTKLEGNYRKVRADLNKVMDNFIDPSLYKHFLILDGYKLEADKAYEKIFKSANKTIYYIDNYIGVKTLDLLSFAKEKVSIIIFSDNKATPQLKQSIIDDFNSQNKGHNIVLYKSFNRFHDRYIVIDYGTKNEVIYHCGASSKDSGKKITTIEMIEKPELYRPIIDYLLNSQID